MGFYTWLAFCKAGFRSAVPLRRYGHVAALLRSLGKSSKRKRRSRPGALSCHGAHFLRQL